MLEGLLVDLVPYGDRFLKLEHKWYNSEVVFFWTTGDRWFVSEAEIEWWQRERREDPARQANRIVFGVQTKDGTPIGMFGITRLHPTYRLAMLTAFIGEPDYWDGGYGTDALLLVIEYAFAWLDVRKAWLATMSANPRVVRQMEKVGFTLEARQRQSTSAHGQWVDTLFYGLLREEWPGRAEMIDKLHIQTEA
jgi:RimJ/RimL family protein N-acetyltransferase